MPTTTISGATDCDDTAIWSIQPTRNYGVQVEISSRRTSDPSLARSLTRCSAAAIPSGTVTGFRYLARGIRSGGTDFSIYLYRIKDANTWGEGIHNSATATAGEACWDYAKYNTQAWAGTAGCGTDGTDYFSDASPPSVVMPSGYAFVTFTMPTSWATDWRDGVVVANGFMSKGLEATVGDGGSWQSLEAASNQPYFEIDYTSVPVFVNYYRQRRT